jgi:DNA-binding beta-propeller fold protein YncE
VQTLARFGSSAICHGVSVDSTGSVYVGVSESSDSKDGNIVVVEADTSKTLQLPITVPGLKCVAVSPDGSELYVGCKDGRVLCYKQPWSQPSCEEMMHLEGAEIKHMVASSDR